MQQNIKVGSLEAAIRQKAEIKAREEFRKHTSHVTRFMHSGLRVSSQEKEGFWAVLKELERTHCERAADEAVNQFVATYEGLIQQFPQLKEDIAAEAVYQNQEHADG